jgi:hypothetical protein
MVAQRRAAIVLAEQAAAMQDRHHRVDEDLEPGRQYIRHQIEAVGGAGSKPCLDVVGDVFRRADDDAMADTATECPQELAYGEISAPSQIDGALEHRVIGVGGQRQWIGQRLIEFEHGGINLSVLARRARLYSMGTSSQSSSCRRFASASVLPITVASPGRITMDLPDRP